MLDQTNLKADVDRIGYVVKRYPRYSETFIVNEILSHESAGLPIEIFSARPPVDTHFQDLISLVRAPVHYLPANLSKASDFWRLLSNASASHPVIASRLHRMLKHDPADVAAAVALANHAVASGITHFHAHFATSASNVAWLASELSGIPFTMTAHAKDIFHDSVDQESLVAKLKSARATVTVSDFNMNYLQQRYGDAADRVVRIYNGLNLDEFPYCPGAGRRPIILAVGRLVEKKGFDVLVDACAILAKRGLEFSCQVIGDGGEAEFLRSRVSESGLDRRVEFLGPQPQELVKKALRNAAIFAAPCVQGSDGNRDGLPTVLLEAMAIGTPCVSTPVTGIPEAVRHNDTGLLVPERDPHALANALQKLLSDSETSRRLAEAARRHIESEFDIQRNALMLRQLFGVTNHQQKCSVGHPVDTVLV